MVQELSRARQHVAGRYRVLARIGAGGMGEVFRAESEAGEPVAVKVIREDLLDLDTRLRFAREVQALKTVTGPRVACLIDADAEAEPPWLATQYVHGPNLLQQVEQIGPLPAELVAILGAALAEGLRSIELAGLLHRDLKPHNIVLGPTGPVVIDFGLAVMVERKLTLTATGAPVGTAAYMSPEQALGEKDVTSATDVYGLGATLLFAATGRYPYDATGYAAMINKITDRGQPPDLRGVPEALEPPLAAMLRYDAADRPGLSGIITGLVDWLKEQGLTAAEARERLIDVTTAGIAPPPEAPPRPRPQDAVPQDDTVPQDTGGQDTARQDATAETVRLAGTPGEAETLASRVRTRVQPDRHAAAVVADRLGAAYARRATLRNLRHASVRRT